MSRGLAGRGCTVVTPVFFVVVKDPRILGDGNQHLRFENVVAVEVSVGEGCLTIEEATYFGAGAGAERDALLGMDGTISCSISGDGIWRAKYL